MKKRFVTAGLRGRESVQIAYMPECMDTIWLYENGTYIALALVQKTYLGKTLAEVADAQQREKVERIDWEKQELQAQLDLMSDIKLIGIARNTYYKYKRELREQSAGLPPL